MKEEERKKNFSGTKSTEHNKERTRIEKRDKNSKEGKELRRERERVNGEMCQKSIETQVC